MNEELKKYQDLVSGLMQKLDAERQRASRLEHELFQYHEGKSLADQLAEKDGIINRQKRTIDKLNAQLTFDFGELSVSPEEEEAYGKAHEELDAYHQQRKDDIERTIRCATAPHTPIAKSHAGSIVLANLMVGKYVDSLPTTLRHPT